MKHSIEWHKACLTNNKRYLAERIKEMLRLNIEVAELKSQTAFYEQQIEEAERRRKDGFDAEKFM